MLDEIRRTIVLKFVEMVPTSGVSDETLRRACGSPEYICLFPAGVHSVLEYLNNLLDVEFLERMQQYDLTDMGIRARVKLAIKVKLEVCVEMMPNVTKSLKSIMLFCTKPLNTVFGLKMLYMNVDSIWCAIGDRTADFNFYTKRASLGMIFIATVIYFVNYESELENLSRTLRFIDKYVERAASVGGFKRKLKSFLPNIQLFNVDFK